MARLTAELVASLVDKVSGPARLMGSALKAADAQARAIAAASKAGLGNKFAADLTRIGSSAGTIDKVTRAWERYRREAGLAADATKWTKGQIGQARQWERSHIAALKSVEAAKARIHGAATPAAGAQAGATPAILAAAPRYLGPAALAYTGTQAVKKSAEAERAITRIGVTADATSEALKGVGDTSFRIAQEVAMPYASVVSGLDTLVAQGRTLEDSMNFLPSVARTASAAAAEVTDIANTADSVSTNFKIAGKEMQTAFDIMAAGGKAGKFELKDMSRYLPSLGPAASAIGFTGEKGLSDLVSMLQVMRKGSGTAEEAVSSMNNILAKMESDKTTKAFKTLGVDSEAAFKKARKEGKNLVEVFEELVDKALKGDRSRLGEIIDDMEFKRGTQALMTYRGEWQKMSATIRSTSAGTVGRDLEKVTANTQAKLDRLANAYERRMRQLGSVISDVLVPIDNKISEITDGKNPTVSRVVEQLQRGSIESSARHEIMTGERYGLNDDRRREVDARKEGMRRELVEQRLASYDAEIAAKEAELASLAARTRGAGKTRQDAVLGPRRAGIDKIKAERDGLQGWQRNVDELTVQVAEKQGARDRATRALRSADPIYAPRPTPLAPNSSMAFGFGPHGARPQPGMTMSAPLPPSRPGSLPKAVDTLKSFDDIFTPQVDASSVDAAGVKFVAAKDKLALLDTTVDPRISTDSVDAFIGKLQTALALYGQIGAAQRSASAGVAGLGSAPAGRGRSDVATATANLSRSRELNNTGRSFIGGYS